MRGRERERETCFTYHSSYVTKHTNSEGDTGTAITHFLSKYSLITYYALVAFLDAEAMKMETYALDLWEAHSPMARQPQHSVVNVLIKEGGTCSG